MATQLEQAKTLKAKLQEMKMNKPAKVETPEPGTFCQVAFCSDQASHFLHGRPVCNIHFQTFTAIDATN